MSITQNVCEFVALGIHHAMSMRHVVICGLPRCTIFIPYYLINGKIFEKVPEYEICVSSFSTNSIRNIFHYNKK